MLCRTSNRCDFNSSASIRDQNKRRERGQHHPSVHHSSFSASHDNVIDFEDHADAFCGKSECTCRDKGWLHDSFLLHVHDCALTDVNASVTLSVRVPVAKLSHEQNWVESSILSQRVRDELKGFTVGFAHVGVVAIDGS